MIALQREPFFLASSKYDFLKQWRRMMFKMLTWCFCPDLCYRQQYSCPRATASWPCSHMKSCFSDYPDSRLRSRCLATSCWCGSFQTQKRQPLQSALAYSRRAGIVCRLEIRKWWGRYDSNLEQNDPSSPTSIQQGQRQAICKVLRRVGQETFVLES